MRTRVEELRRRVDELREELAGLFSSEELDELRRIDDTLDILTELDGVTDVTFLVEMEGLLSAWVILPTGLRIYVEKTDYKAVREAVKEKALEIAVHAVAKLSEILRGKVDRVARFVERVEGLERDVVRWVEEEEGE